MDDAKAMAAKAKEGASKAATDVARTATEGSLLAEISFLDSEIASAKAKWGRDCYANYYAGDMDVVKEAGDVCFAKIQTCQASLLEKHAKRVKNFATTTDEVLPNGGVSVALKNKRKIVAIVPAGVKPGETFTVKADGRAVTAADGTEI